VRPDEPRPQAREAADHERQQVGSRQHREQAHHRQAPKLARAGPSYGEREQERGGGGQEGGHGRLEPLDGDRHERRADGERADGGDAGEERALAAGQRQDREDRGGGGQGQRLAGGLRPGSEQLAAGDEGHPQGRRVAVDARAPEVPDRPVPVGQVVGVAERDVRVVGREGEERHAVDERDQHQHQSDGDGDG
jgi:hypothetical protein